jgi:hypothetical protein
MRASAANLKLQSHHLVLRSPRSGRLEGRPRARSRLPPCFETAAQPSLRRLRKLACVRLLMRSVDFDMIGFMELLR